MKSVKLPDPRRCPSCWRSMNVATGPTAGCPNPGDIGMCCHCGEVFELLANGDLVVCDDPDIRLHPAVVDIRFVILAREAKRGLA